MTSKQSNLNNKNLIVSAVGSADETHQDDVAPAPHPQSENVTFSESPIPYSLDLTSAPDATFGETGAKDSNFEGFLHRFIEIGSPIEWTVGTDTAIVLDPWTLWRTNARIAAKLKNFRYLKCDLEVMFTINGTPFHYGQMMAAYAPMMHYWANNFMTASAANSAKSSLYNFYHYSGAGTAPTVATKELVDGYFSTFPHVLLTPGDNHSMTMKLPFIWHNNYLRVNHTTSTYSDGVTGMESPGMFYITDLVGLKRATDLASNSVTIAVWCRAINIDLNTPTSAVASSDETAKASSPGGFISNMASGVAKFASQAAVIPGVRPYAKATEVAATSVGNLASLFGFSRPIDVSSAHHVGVTNARNMALTNTSDTSQKLAFDAHQEVSVDSRVIGADGTDEMCFAAINQKWYWCGKAPWTPTAVDGPLSKGFLAADPLLLYRCLVSPTMWRHFLTTHSIPVNAWHLNPAGYLANTFNFWNASITYRVQVVASRMHTGRIKIQFDPASGDSTLDDIETRYTWILDLAESREIDITIPFTAFRGYLRRQGLASHGLQDPAYSNVTTATTTANFNDNVHMGFFSIHIVNHLSAPNGVNGLVHVNVWQRVDDAEYQVPGSDWHSNILKSTSSSDEELIEASDPSTEILGGPLVKSPMWMTNPSPNRTAVWFGERVLSIRALMKRYMYANTLVYNQTNNGMSLTIFTIPHWPGVSESSWGLKNTYVSYFTPCYLAKRGGMRAKTYTWVCGDSGTTAPTLTTTPNTATNAERIYSTSYVGYSSSHVNVASSSAFLYDQDVAGGASGGVLCGSGLGDQLVEVESPYYMNMRFQLAQYYANSNSPIDEGCNYLRFTKIFSNSSTMNNRLSIYQAAAEDTSFMYFLAAPVLYGS